MTTQDHPDDTRRALAAGIAHDVPRNRPQPNGNAAMNHDLAPGRH